jgi:hypothetical protein
MDDWFSNPLIHGILQNVIQVLTWHPQPPLVEGQKHHGKKNPCNYKPSNH